MNNKKNLVSMAIAGVLMAGQAEASTNIAGKEKCYGVSKKGQNDCATATHNCGGATNFKDFDPNEWKYVKKDTCVKMGGSLIAGKKGTKKPAKK